MRDAASIDCQLATSALTNAINAERYAEENLQERERRVRTLCMMRHITNDAEIQEQLRTHKFMIVGRYLLEQATERRISAEINANNAEAKLNDIVRRYRDAGIA